MPRAASIRVRCPAKINLGLWILGRRPDGFHEIDTILQTVALEDLLEIERDDARPGIRLTLAGLPVRGEGPNLVERAWERLLEVRPDLRGAGIAARLEKHIPVGAGLGGGSSDAAGLLAGVNACFGLGMPAEALEEVAAELGSDVPFFIRGGTARATGRGEHVRHIGPLPPTWVVLVSPPFAISTSWAYEQVRKRLTRGGGDASILASAVASGDVGAAVRARYNAFEDVVLPHLPRLAALQHSFVATGAWGPLLSGSGSSLFSLARTNEEAQAVATAMAAQDADVRVVRTRERGVTAIPSR
ncbi:MAG TPA: 4-(cytidine 5'-diphospho)-2-C-methyl-D-erythritol kinase [Acidobacteriota bacterium]|nr:4-(cytidine 5'-diphospho)-2-C-methyl-D-erythritol kinase [Acidobacteriota bacterium]